MIIKWTNKYSGEQGYVMKLHRKEEYFENTFDETEALSVPKKDVKKTISLLDGYCPNNTYEAIEK